MKKVSLFLTVIGAILLMTSCMKGGSNNYTESSFVYLQKDSKGTIYGKTFSRSSLVMRIITAESMAKMEPGTFKAIAYRWDEANGYKPLMIDEQTIQADNVMVSNEVDIPTTSLRMQALPEVEKVVSFDKIESPLYANSAEVIGDYWMFEYTYTAKEGEKANVEFYKREEGEQKDEIVIDIHLTLSGTPSGTSTKKVGGAIALNMAPLRAAYSGSAKKDLKIKFKYYVDGDQKESAQPYTLTVGGEK